MDSKRVEIKEKKSQNASKWQERLENEFESTYIEGPSYFVAKYLLETQATA